MTQIDDKRLAERIALAKKVEFFVDADIIQADTLDVSESGLRMKTDNPIQIQLRIYHEEDDFEQHGAQLVWAKREDGTMTYGFEYVSSPEW